MKYLFLVIVLFLFGCSKDNNSPLTSFKGDWVEQTNRKDTIRFAEKFNSNDIDYFTFSSAKGIRGYNELHVAMYDYTIKGDTISIHNMVLSCFCFSNHYFNLANDKLRIGNFYDSNSPEMVMTFVPLQ